MTSPVYNVKAIPVEKIRANSYNPNSVAPPEMKLLETSIWEDGYTMPVVCYYIEEEDIYEIVDGFHRYTVLKTSKRIFERENGLLPVTVIDKPISGRMASTIRHNRARGSHSIDLMKNIVAELVESGMSDVWIMKNIGMDSDELLRLKQISGIAALFEDSSFSQAWCKGEDDELHYNDSFDDTYTQSTQSLDNSDIKEVSQKFTVKDDLADALIVEHISKDERHASDSKIELLSVSDSEDDKFKVSGIFTVMVDKKITSQQRANKKQNEKRLLQEKIPSICIDEGLSSMMDDLVKIYGSKSAAVKEAIKKLHESINTA